MLPCVLLLGVLSGTPLDGIDKINGVETNFLVISLDGDNPLKIGPTKEAYVDAGGTYTLPPGKGLNTLFSSLNFTASCYDPQEEATNQVEIDESLSDKVNLARLGKCKTKNCLRPLL